jgi:hypothetical protein
MMESLALRSTSVVEEMAVLSFAKSVVSPGVSAICLHRLSDSGVAKDMQKDTSNTERILKQNNDFDPCMIYLHL